MDKKQKEYFQNVKQVFAKDATGIKVYEELKNAYQERSSFSKDALEMAYREGQRSVFLELQSIVEAK